MKERIKKPDWLKSYEYIKYSYNINKFIEIYRIDSIDNMDIKFLRDYYKKDKEACLDLIDELVLRGFKFDTEKESPLLPNISIELDDKIILLDDNQNRYKNINFARLNISNFVKRFNVQSDYFFNYIKIDYFLYLNKNISLSVLNEEFETTEMLYVNKTKNEDLPKESNYLSIDEVYNKPIFSLFIKYCTENNLVYINDLVGFDFNILYSVKGLGKGKIIKIIDRYNEVIMNGNGEVIDKKVEGKISINSNFKNISINSLSAFGLSQNIIEVLKDKINIHYLRDFEEYRISDFKNINGIGVSKIKELEEIILTLNNNCENIYIDILKKIKRHKYFNIYKLRILNKLTLKDIAEIRGCSRQRIKQQEKKIKRIFEGYFGVFKEFFKDSLNNDKCITMDDIERLFPEYDDANIIRYSLENNMFKEYSYMKEFNIFISNESLKELDYTLSVIKDNIPSVFKIEDINIINDILINNDLDFIDEDDIIKYLIDTAGYKKLNNYLWQGRELLGKIYSYIIKEHYPNGINVYTDEIEELRLKVKEEFGIDDRRGKRAIVARICYEAVLCDRGKYINPDFIRIPDFLLNEIKEYIDNNVENSIAIRDIFSKFEHKLVKMSNVKNRYFLHGVIKYYYKDEYKFSRDILSKNGIKVSSNKLLEEFLKEKKQAVSKKELSKKFKGWTTVMFANAPNINKNILVWDIGMYIHRDNLHVSNEDINKLRKIIDEKLNDDTIYININSIYNKVNLKMRRLFKENNIKNSSNLFYLLDAFLNDEYIFKRNIIYKKGLSEDKYRDVFEMYIQNEDIINYEDYVEYFKFRKFKDSTIYAGFRRQREKLIQISLREYIKVSDLGLDDETINDVKNFILEKLNKSKYIAVFDITNYISLPNIRVEWSPYLITDIINKYIKELRIINPEFKDRRYIRPIIVKKNSKMADIVDIIIYVIKHEYDDPENLIISKVRDYLISKNIIFQSIPNEFYESNKTSIDEYNRITKLEE